MPEAKKPGKDVVYLDVEDDITTIVDKVEGAKDKIVALVLPKRFATLQSIVNMRLLKRSAKTADKNVVLITSEAALLPLAGAAGIHVAKNLQSKPEIPPSPVDAPTEKLETAVDPDAEVDKDDAKLDYHRSIGVLAATHAVDDHEAIPLDDEGADENEKPAKKTKAEKDKKLKVPDFDRFRLRMALFVLAAIGILLFLYLAFFVWPKATVTLQTEATPVSASFNLTTSPKATELDEKKGVIPASLQKSDLKSSQQVQATGQKNTGEKATGNVAMTICASSPAQVSNVPAGTGISTGGLSYVTQQTASFTFTGGCSGSSFKFQSNSVSIVAVQPGSKYNLSISAASVSNSNATADGTASGGSDDIKTVVSQSDVDAVKNKISDEDKTKFGNEFKQLLSDKGYYVIDSTVKASDPVVTSEPSVGKEADKANVSVKVTYSALVVKKDDLKKAVTDELNKQIDLKKQKLLAEDVLKNVGVEVESQKSSTVATLTVNKDAVAVPALDISAIKKLVAGQKAGVIKSMLGGYPGIKEVDIKMSPFWVSKAPKKPSHIVIVQKEAKNVSSGG